MNQSSPGPRLRARSPSGEVAAVAPADVAALDADLHGAMFTPTDEGYDDARRLWNGAIDVKPAVIARCCNVADVVKAIEFAKQQRMIVSVRGGGHNVAGTALIENGLVLDR